MTPETTPFAWTGKAERAALLVAEDRLTDVQIAADIGMTRPTLARWKRHPEFTARAAEIVAKARAAVEAEGIANVKNRVAAQHDRWERLQRLIAARGNDPTLADIPGGDSGFLVRTAKLVKVYTAEPTAEELANLDTPPEQLRAAKREVLVYEYTTDVSPAAELRATEKQAAQELGQWTEKSEIAGKDGKPLAVANIAFDFPAFERAFADAAGVAAPPDHDLEQSLDSSGADREAGGVPGAAGA
jgi:hypothetical protein